MDTIGLFDRYRWLVRNSIESPSFQQNSDLALAYLRVRRSDFSVSESVAESMIQFYIAERNKKNLPKKDACVFIGEQRSFTVQKGIVQLT